MDFLERLTDYIEDVTDDIHCRWFEGLTIALAFLVPWAVGVATIVGWALHPIGMR